MTDPRFAEIEGHRPYLMRFAISQLRDAQLAEAAVQEALPSGRPAVSARAAIGRPRGHASHFPEQSRSEP